MKLARQHFCVKKWLPRCPPVIALRTTNCLERINEEFRRRTKTQALLPSQDAVLWLLFGLLRSGQIKLRRIDGWQEMASVRTASAKAA